MNIYTGTGERCDETHGKGDVAGVVNSRTCNQIWTVRSWEENNGGKWQREIESRPSDLGRRLTAENASEGDRWWARGTVASG